MFFTRILTHLIVFSLLSFFTIEIFRKVHSMDLYVEFDWATVFCVGLESKLQHWFLYLSYWTMSPVTYGSNKAYATHSSISYYRRHPFSLEILCEKHILHEWTEPRMLGDLLSSFIKNLAADLGFRLLTFRLVLRESLLHLWNSRSISSIINIKNFKYEGFLGSNFNYFILLHSEKNQYILIQIPVKVLLIF